MQCGLDAAGELVDEDLRLAGLERVDDGRGYRLRQDLLDVGSLMLARAVDDEALSDEILRDVRAALRG